MVARTENSPCPRLSSSTWIRRLSKELAEIQVSPPANVRKIGLIDERNYLKWQATIIGPQDSPYRGEIFDLTIDFPPEYPFRPPTVTFKTRINHPNIDSNGNVRLDILKQSQWRPQFKLAKVLHCIVSMLKNPNADKCESTGREWTKNIPCMRSLVNMGRLKKFLGSILI